MSNKKEITVPDIGQFSNVEVIEIPVKVGDEIKAEDTLVTLETEKASMDVPSPVSGKLVDLKVKLGDKVSQGSLIAVIEVAGEETPKKEVKEESKTPKAEEKAPEKSEVKEQEAAPVQSVSEIKVPDIGNFSEVEIIEVSIKPGDVIKKEDPLITIETEKAAMDIPSPVNGTVKELKVKQGDKVSQGTLIALVETTATSQAKEPTAAESKSEPKAEEKPTPKAVEKPIAAATLPDASKVHAGPATRRLAREFGIDLNKVTGSGRKGRIVTTDLQNYVKNLVKNEGQGQGLGIEKMPEVDFAQFGEVEVKPLSRIKKWTAKNLHRNWVLIPHITQFDEADITEMEKFREENKQAALESGIKLTPLPFVIKAIVSALKAFPQFNASLASNGNDVIYKKYYNIGIAVDTPTGLMVPVIRNADCKSLFELAKEIIDLGLLARQGKLKAEQMTGSCFTISSLGSVGGTAFTPIINAPDLAILGISKAQIKPIYRDNQFVPCKMLPFSLSYDHRVIDGVEGAKFLNHIIEQIQDIRKLLL